MKELACMFFGLWMAMPVLSQGLAFGPNPLHLEEAAFVSNTRTQPRIRSVAVRMDWEFSKQMADIFPEAPTRIYQSRSRPDRAILILNGRSRFPSQIFLAGSGMIPCVVTIPPGQGPGEMRNVGNAAFINDHELVVVGDRKMIRVDVSSERGRILDTLPVTRYVVGSPVRMGSVPDGVLILNDGLKPVGDRGVVPFYSVFRKSSHGMAFLHTGLLYMTQQRSVQRRSMEARSKELAGDPNAWFFVRMMCNRMCDSFVPFHYLVLDTFNRCLFAFNYLENRIERYTAFDEDCFEQVCEVGGEKGLRLFYSDLHANMVDHTIWLIRNRKVDEQYHLVPVRKNGRVIPGNLPEVDVLSADLHYRETLRFIPPVGLTWFALQSIVVTGAGEAYASAFVGRQPSGDRNEPSYELRLVRLTWETGTVH